MRMDDDWLGDALGAGVDACVSKSSHLPSLGTLIREIVSRNIVCAAPRAAARRLSRWRRTMTSRRASGRSSSSLPTASRMPRIGKQLWVTEQTVKFHLSNIYRKLGVSNRTEASRYAFTHGMLRRGPARVAGDAAEAKLASVSELHPVEAAGAA